MLRKPLNPAVDSATGTYNTFLPGFLGALTAENKGTRVVGRILHGTDHNMATADTVKSAARAGTITKAQITAGEALPNLDRRLEKGRFLAYCGRFEKVVQRKYAALKYLATEFPALIATLTGHQANGIVASLKAEGQTTVQNFTPKLHNLDTTRRALIQKLVGKQDEKLESRINIAYYTSTTELAALNAASQ
jgi:hypothetical protein